VAIWRGSGCSFTATRAHWLAVIEGTEHHQQAFSVASCDSDGDIILQFVDTLEWSRSNSLSMVAAAGLYAAYFYLVRGSLRRESTEQ
jgi:hypothetical protein